MNGGRCHTRRQVRDQKRLKWEGVVGNLRDARGSPMHPWIPAPKWTIASEVGRRDDTYNMSCSRDCRGPAMSDGCPREQK